MSTVTDQRQKVFLKLKTPCVNLSTVTLKFRTGELPVKDVLKALEAVKRVLDDLGPAGLLDPKLAEYAFFPLAQQVFNETRRLSPRCLEIAAQCVTLLVKYGYRRSLLPELGKQLLILMSMLAGASPTRENDQVNGEMKIAAFECVLAVIETLKLSAGGTTVLEDQGTKNVVDQLVYLLLDAITNNVSDQVQLAASNTLTLLVTTIESRVFLASLLPRTVSALTKALKPSTKARRTQKVLATNLKALRYILSRTLSDRLALDPATADEKEILDKSWLSATAGQVKNALLQVIKLRTQESISVQNELEQLCVMVIEECHVILVESIPSMLETLVILSAQDNGGRAQLTTQHLVTTYSDVREMLHTNFESLYQSLPLLMQGHDEEKKNRALQRLTTSLQLLPSLDLEFDLGQSDFVPVLVNSVSNAIQTTSNRPIEISDLYSPINTVEMSVIHKSLNFQPFILNVEGQKETSQQLQVFLNSLAQTPTQPVIVRRLIDTVAESDGVTSLAASWLALKLLSNSESGLLDTQEWISIPDQDDQSLKRSSLIADLHATALPLLANVYDGDSDKQYLWQTQALALECVVMYAQTFPGESYRPELMNTLYPVLSFLGSPNSILRSHSINALNNIAQTCQYASAKDLLIDNVDYLVNSVAWKLNTFSLSPEAPQILQMMVRLCGAQLIPYLDDLIQSIFAALDSYHGYPQWVEALFATLKAMVEEGKRQPQLVMTDGEIVIDHKSKAMILSTRTDILSDFRARKRRKLDFDRPADEPPSKAPYRPWTNELDGPTFSQSQESNNLTVQQEDDNDDEDTQDLAPSNQPPKDEEGEKKPSKTHELLLSIAKSTLPHLSSPSPQVRHLLLDLLKDISPLLSRDETSFLPLINAIWPVLVPRLFAEQLSSTDIDTVNGTNTSSETETAYNISAAADTVAILCKGAGDFMASRIEDISAQLLRLVRSTQARVILQSSGNNNGQSSSLDLYALPPGWTISGGPVSLDIVKSDGSVIDNSYGASPGGLTTAAVGGSTARYVPTKRELRTSQRQILHALLGLLMAILDHVRLALDTSDEIMDVLLPYLNDPSLSIDVREVLERYNADALWLFELQSRRQRGWRESVALPSEGQQRKATMIVEEDKVVDMNYEETPQPPVLRKELHDMGLVLMSFET